MERGRTLSHAEARAFYDRFGSRQDSQAFYEDAAVERMLAHGDFGHARRVLEFGCGTGRLAARLLQDALPAEARYLGLDLSDTMVGLARRRLAPFGSRAEVIQTDGSPTLALPDASFDRLASTYVLDLLAESEVRTFLDEAGRVLETGGLLCLVGLTPGVGPLSRLVTRVWEWVHRLRPALVGGCRPLVVAGLLDPGRFEVRHREVVERFGVASEVLLAARRCA